MILLVVLRVSFYFWEELKNFISLITSRLYAIFVQIAYSKMVHQSSLFNCKLNELFSCCYPFYRKKNCLNRICKYLKDKLYIYIFLRLCINCCLYYANLLRSLIRHVGVAFNCITFIPNFIKICHLFQKLKWGTQTRSHKPTSSFKKGMWVETCSHAKYFV
jgi:hypothetical protein